MATSATFLYGFLPGLGSIYCKISLSMRVNACLRQIAATRRIKLYAPEPMTPKLEALIREVEKERLSGKKSEAFDTADLP